MNTLDTVLGYVGIIIWIYGIFLFFRSDLGRLIKRALGIIWQKKYLWFIGFFAGISAYGGEINFLFRQSNSVTQLQGLLEGIRSAFQGGDVARFFQAWKNLWAHNAGGLSVYILLAIILLLVILWLVVLSQAALVRIAGRTQQAKPTGLLDGLSIGTEKFWILVQVNIIGLLIGWGVWVIITGVPAAIYLINGNIGWSITAHIGSILSTIASVIIIFLVHYATAAVVLNDAKLIPAIVDCWRLFRRNVLVSLEMALVLFTVNFVLLMIVLGLTVLLVNIYTVGGFIGMLAIIAVVYAFLSAFGFAAWTIFYLRLLEGKAGSKIGQWTNQVVNFAGQKRAVQ